MTLPAAQRTPDFRVNQSYAGTVNSGSGPKAVYILAEILAAGTMSDGDIEGPISTVSEAETLAGAQSFMAYLVAKAMNEEHGGDTVPIYMVGVAEPAGVTAAQTFTYAGVADSTNTHSIVIGGETYSWTVPSGTNASDAGDLLEAAVNNAAVLGNHPWAAVNAAGTVTVTCKQKGTIGNAIITYVVTIGTEGTQTLVAGATSMAAGTLEPTLTTALANMAAERTEYLAMSMIDTTSIEAVRAHMVTKGAPPEQMKCAAFWGGVKSVALAGTDADTIQGNGDTIRMWFGDCYNSPAWPPIIAVQAAVVHAWEPDNSRPLNGLNLTDVMAPDNQYRFTTAECETLLANGVTPLRTASSNSTKVQIVRSVSLRDDLLDPMDITKIMTMDELRDRMVAQMGKLDRPKLKKDGEPIYTTGCVSAASIGSMLKAVAVAMEREDKLQGYATGALDNRFSNAYGGPGRTEHVLPCDVVDGFHDGACDLVLQLS